MAQDKQQLVDEAVMEKMSVAPPDPQEQGGEGATGGADEPQSGVADEDPLSAHPS